jgi:hypothetical protein
MSRRALRPNMWRKAICLGGRVIKYVLGEDFQFRPIREEGKREGAVRDRGGPSERCPGNKPCCRGRRISATGCFSCYASNEDSTSWAECSMESMSECIYPFEPPLVVPYADKRAVSACQVSTVTMLAPERGG